MARKKTSVLTETATAKKPFQVRIPPDIDAALQLLEERIKKLAPGRRFDRRAVVEAALRQAIATANEELDRLSTA